MKRHLGEVFLIAVMALIPACKNPTGEHNMIDIMGPHRPTSNQEIDLFENRTGVKLPVEYRRWLLKYNGGSPTPSTFRFVEEGEEADSCVAWFYAIYEGRESNLESAIYTFKTKATRIPKDLIPIAKDPGGNQICLGYQGANLGKVFFWDHERECGGEYDNCSFVANSFDEFIAGLRDDDDD